MVEGLTSSATDQGSGLGSGSILTDSHEIEDPSSAPAPVHRDRAQGPLPNDVQTQEILVTLAERPYPFPSRTRKSSSPAPKILRGQPFGKIGRRQDFCVSGADRRPRNAGGPVDDRRRVSSSQMTTPLDEAVGACARAGSPRPASPTTVASPPRIDDICPYLLASQGGWRSASPNRDHRCTAVDPPAPLATDKQRDLCLTAEHATCPTFRAARANRASTLAPGLDPSDRRGRGCRPATGRPDDRRRPRAPPARDRRGRDRQRGPVPGRARRPDGAGLHRGPDRAHVRVRVATGGRTHAVDHGGPDRDASPDADAVAVARRLSTAVGLRGPRPAAQPRARRPFRTTYRVKAGDTLVGIAADVRHDRRRDPGAQRTHRIGPQDRPAPEDPVTPRARAPRL